MLVRFSNFEVLQRAGTQTYTFLVKSVISEKSQICIFISNFFNENPESRNKNLETVEKSHACN